MTLREQLERDEGRRRKPYTDSVGKLTIGIGHNLTDRGLTDQQIDDLLEDDLYDVKVDLDRELPWARGDLNDVRYAVLANMCFNLGIFGLLAFQKMLAAARAGDYAGAAREMLDSRWARQVGARAERLARQMEEGVEIL